MKKSIWTILFLLLWVLSLLVTLLGCETETPPVEKTDITVPIYKYGEVSCQSVQAYETYIKNDTVPVGFVGYDQISQLGEFKEFHYYDCLLKHKNCGSFNCHHNTVNYFEYILTDRTHSEIKLHIRVPHQYDEVRKGRTLTQEQAQTKHIQRLPECAGTSYGPVFNHVKFEYDIDKNLTCINWIYDHQEYSLYLPVNYPTDATDTFVGQMLQSFAHAEENIMKLCQTIYNTYGIRFVYGKDESISIDSYLTYRLFFATQPELHEKFILYDKLSQIGVFTSFFNHADYNNKDTDTIPCNEYLYKFKDTSGTMLTLFVRNLGKELPSNTTLPETDWNILVPNDISNISGIRYLKGLNRSGVVEVNNIRYYYLAGKLYAIEWAYNGLVFSLSDLTDYTDAQTDTFASKLLFTHNDAEAAIAKLNAAMFALS